MNEQEIFDKVEAHLIKQKVQAAVVFVAKTQCQYRTPEGHMCAFGIFIPDEVYTPEIEGFGCNDLFQAARDPKRQLRRVAQDPIIMPENLAQHLSSLIHVGPAHARLYSALQGVHDARPLVTDALHKEWAKGLALVAEDFELKPFDQNQFLARISEQP